MSGKTTRNENFKKQTIVKRKLEKLNKEILELECKINGQKRINLKNFHIKNLKIFGSVSSFVVPYVLVATICIGGVCLFEGGLPFVLDDVTKYKRYSLVYQTDALINSKDYYETDYWFCNKLPDSELKIYSPWELTADNNYSRVVQIYDIDDLETLDLYKAVLNNNVEYIEQNFTDFKEEIEITNMKQEDSDQYVIEATLHFIDKSDTLKVKESQLKNIIITLTELAVSFGFGFSINAFRQKSLKESITNIKNQYKSIPIEPLEEELKQKKDKILNLTRGLKNVK